MRSLSLTKRKLRIFKIYFKEIGNTRKLLKHALYEPTHIHTCTSRIPTCTSRIKNTCDKSYSMLVGRRSTAFKINGKRINEFHIAKREIFF